MKRKLFTILIMSLIIAITFLMAGQVFAYGPPADGSNTVSVDPGSVTVDQPDPNGPATVSGSIDTTAISEVNGNGSTGAFTEGSYTINGGTTTIGQTTDSGGKNSTSDASNTYTWSVILTDPGSYDISQSGYASAYWYKNFFNQDFDQASGSSDIVTVIIGVTPPPPPPPLPPPPAPPAYDPGYFACTPSMFTLLVGGTYKQYNWTDGSKGNTLPAIEQEGIVHLLGGVCKLKVVITEGTQHTGGTRLQVTYFGDELHLRTVCSSMPTFSIPAQYYLFVDGAWVEITP
jgi:hypothetical protein